MRQKLCLILGLLLLFPSMAMASTRYVRTDGGTGSQCTGLTDHALAGATGTACAVNHPNWVLPPRGESTARAAVDGDTIVVHGPEAGTGVYRLGCQGTADCRNSAVNLTDNAFCAAAYPYDCYGGAVPDNVLVVGCSITGCNGATQPQLWGAGGIGSVLSVAGSTGAIVQDLEITDHAACGQANGAFSCGSGVNNVAAADGINQIGAQNPYYKDLYIHGMERYAFLGGSVANPTYDHINIDKNAYGGINFDNCGSGACASTGDLIFNFVTVTFSGCIENYPPDGTPNDPNGITQCYDQNDSGYGDGIATNQTGGNWSFYNCDISHNVQDAVDLLYHDNSGTIFASRYRGEGNTGTQFKSAAHVNIMENSKLVGNCEYFETAGLPLNAGFSTCRNSGDVVQISPVLGQTTTFTNVSMWGEDGTIIDNGNFGGANTCNGTETMTFTNVIAFGEPRVDGGGSNSSLYYCSGSDGDGAGNCCSGGTALVPITRYSDIWNTKDAPVAGTGNINLNPKWNQGDDMSPEPDTDNFDMTLKAISPARDIGYNSATFYNGSPDYNNFQRSGIYDLGGFEYSTIADQCVSSGLYCLDATDCCSGICNSGACSITPGTGASGRSGSFKIGGNGKFQ